MISNFFKQIPKHIRDANITTFWNIIRENFQHVVENHSQCVNNYSFKI